MEKVGILFTECPELGQHVRNLTVAGSHLDRKAPYLPLLINIDRFLRRLPALNYLKLAYFADIQLLNAVARSLLIPPAARGDSSVPQRLIPEPCRMRRRQ